MTTIGIKNVSEELTILIANTTGDVIELPDMSGATISGYAGIGGAEYYPLSEYFSFASINESEDLPPLVASGTLVVNDGLKDLTISEGLKHIRYATAFETELIYEDQIGATSFLDLGDTPTTYSGVEERYVRVNASGTGLEYGLSESNLSEIFSSVQFSGDPTYDGIIRMLGWYEQINLTPGGSPGPKIELSSENPHTSTEKGFHSHFIMNITVVSGTPFNITVSGTVVDETIGDYNQKSESITISGVAYYQTTKSFIDAPIFSIVESTKSCNMDLYRSTYWDAQNQNFRLEGCRFEWTPDQENWDLDLKIYHHLEDGSLYIIDDIIFNNNDIYPRADVNKPGKYKRGDYNRIINGASNEGILLYFDQRAIGHYYFELRFTLMREEE